MRRRILPLLLSLALCLGMLPTAALAVETKETAGDFNVTGDASGYSYADGVLTVKNNANITISMASGVTGPTSDRIVVAENATATITLAGVNIKGSDLDSNQNIAAKSAIDLSNESILTIDLSANTENTLTGGSGNTDGSGAPGIHVPDSASLIIQGNGSLSVSGGTSSMAYGGVGIGGNASTTSAGEACGTVICFASRNVTITAGTQASGSVPADDIGGGNGQNQNNGDDGQGIRPGTDSTYTVYGDLELPCDITIPQGAKVVIPEGASLTVPEGVELTNNGTITGSGSVTVSGDVSGNGSMSVTGTVTKKDQNAPNTPSTANVTDTSVTLSAVTDSGGIGGIEYGYTTGTETEPDHWQKSNTFTNLAVATSYTFYARYAGNDYYEPSPASSGLTVTTNKSDTALGNLTVSGQTGFQGHFQYGQYGDVITVTFTPERKENNSTNALAENTATLTYTPTEGEAVTLATAATQADGSFELTYDTKEKKLPIGENLSLTVSYGGSGALNPVEETVTLSLDKAILMNVPSVSGNFVYGETLTANYTKQDDETVTYQWYRSGEIISSATEASYTPTAEDIGKNILVEIIATDEWHRGKMRSTERMVTKAPGSIEIACDSVTYGTAVSPSVTSTTNEGATVTYTYTGVNGTDYPASTTAPHGRGHLHRHRHRGRDGHPHRGH